MTAAKAIAATGTSTPSNMATNLGSLTSPPSTVVVKVVMVVVVGDVVVMVVVDVVVGIVVVRDSVVDDGSVFGVSEVMSAVGVGAVSGGSVSVDPVSFVTMAVNAGCEEASWKALLS